MENTDRIDNLAYSLAEILDEYHEKILPLVMKGRLYDELKKDCEIPDDIDIKSYIINLKQNNEPTDKVKEIMKAVEDFEYDYGTFEENFGSFADGLRNLADFATGDMEKYKRLLCDYGDVDDISYKLNEYEELLDDCGCEDVIRDKVSAYDELMEEFYDIDELKERIDCYTSFVNEFGDDWDNLREMVDLVDEYDGVDEVRERLERESDCEELKEAVRGFIEHVGGLV